MVLRGLMRLQTYSSLSQGREPFLQNQRYGSLKEHIVAMLTAWLSVCRKALVSMEVSLAMRHIITT